MSQVDRRTLMRLAAAGLSSALAPLGACARQISQVDGTSQRPTPDAPLTPPDAWYSVSLTGAYRADLQRYRLRIGGLVRRPLRLDLAALRRDFPAHVLPVTLACVGNRPGGGLVSSALFRGARLADVLEQAGVSDAEPITVLVTGLEGYVAYRSLADLRVPQALLAYDIGTSEDSMVPLTIDRGFPLRLLTPGYYGYVQPKWIDGITLRERSAHLEVLRRSIDYLDGRMQLASDFTHPLSGEVLAAGAQEVLGFAYGDGRPIAEVVVELDGRPAPPAELVWNDLADGLPAHVWTLWRWRWQATPGRHRLSCRARYQDGEWQMTGRRFPYSGGTTTTIEVEVA